MEGATKLMLILAIVLMVSAANVEGGRKLVEKETVDRPQNYMGAFGGTAGFIPSPSGPTLYFGPTGYCSFPGPGCVRINPTLPGGAIGSPP
ncbi:hypothetical protein Tsubulata_047546 [Turnera subulata]|uniref:Uncharacterized protein n=1 Tax=Turnera subulata TaxID=218843 RepID=A0A9Q0FBM2_9ROSI|nr:hypothetical protein Tsubulata_047546 [Turnera subulata]